MNRDQEAPTPRTAVLFGHEARLKLQKGLDTAAEAVGCTLGPRGRTVLIQHGTDAAFVTKDGSTVSKSIRLSDPVEAMGADLIREASSRTNDVAGDGTTTATVLTQSLVSEGLKLMAAGHDSVLLKKGIEIGVKKVIEYIRTSSRAVDSYDDIKHIGTISANGDENIGNLIAAAMETVGKDGIITVEDAKGMNTTMDVVEGMQVDRGYVSPYFVTNNEKMCAQYVDAYVIVTDRKLSGLSEIVPLLESLSKSGRGFIIIAEEVEGEALQALVINKTKGTLKPVVIRAPGYGKLKDQLLEDIAVLTGTRVASSQTGVSLEKMTINDLGQCKKLIVTANNTTIVGTGRTAEDVSARVEQLRSQLKDVTLDPAEVVHLKTRIARLSSGVAVVHVGGSTELEMIERKYRIEDALHATRAASEEGIVRGGGMCLLQSSWLLLDSIGSMTDLERDVRAGIETVAKACQTPISRIVKNAGGSPAVVIDKLSHQRFMSNIQYSGWDASRGEVCDMAHRGIVDPARVIRVALENASSVAVTFLNLDAVVYNEGK